MRVPVPVCIAACLTAFAGARCYCSYHPGRTTSRPPALINGSAVNGSAGTTAAPYGADDTGLVTATTWDPAAFDTYVFPHSQWSLEIRFPLRQTPEYWTKAQGPQAHGGLLDADPTRQHTWNQYDPALGDAGPGRPRYWWVNFAKAEHVRQYNMPDNTSVKCPKNCTAALEHAVNSTKSGGSDVQKYWPTFLGGYWEWVWGPVGDANPGVGYMHRPSSFPLVQFANSTGERPCGNIEFPGRHAAKSLYLAQVAYSAAHNNTFASSIGTLLNASYCNLDLGTSDTCDLDALQFAADHPGVFKMGVTVVQNTPKITRACPTRPCYMASVQVTVPAAHKGAGTTAAQDPAYVYVVTVNSNRDTVVEHPHPQMEAPCLA